MLYTEPVQEDMETLPSPEALKRKIIVKAKKQAAAEKASESESEEEEEAERIAVDMKADIHQVMTAVTVDISVCWSGWCETV
jgi:hypothetical protein